MEQEIRKGVGRNIAIFRKRKGLSQKELAEMIGIGLPNISYIENGKYAPRMNTLIKLSQVLETQMYEFFILERHKQKDNIKAELLKALDEDEILLRLIYRIYLAIKTDYAPYKETEDMPINAGRKRKKPN